MSPVGLGLWDESRCGVGAAGTQPIRAGAVVLPRGTGGEIRPRVSFPRWAQMDARVLSWESGPADSPA